jgi:hypothetical protein
MLVMLLPWVLRLTLEADPCNPNVLNGLILVFIITAWISSWTAYDQISAFHKALWITASVFLCYALGI